MALWDKLPYRGNVEDRRGMGMALGGGGGIVGLILVLAFTFLGGDPDSQTLDQILSQLQPGNIAQQQSGQPSEFQGSDKYEVFASTVIGSNNETWKSILDTTDTPYREPRLVLFRNATSSGCGIASSQTGPHYCSLDETIYLDETFFDELQSRFGAEGGDVAEAYVLSHEVGHHVQQITGIMTAVQNEQRRDRAAANELSVKLELQADCYAGIWANSVSQLGVFQPGEINEAVNAAESVGDDNIQETIQGRINPESWTHGSSAQRVEWFNRGLSSGDIAQCNTFDT